MPASLALTLRSTLKVAPDVLWDEVTQVERVNQELGGLSLRLPFGYDRLEPTLIRRDEPAVHGTVLAGGVVPVERMAMHLETLEPGRFVEKSESWWFRHWRHERVVKEAEAGCQVVDRVVCEPRLPGLAVVLLPVLARLFERRHRHLRAQYGSPQADAPRAQRTLGAGAEQEAALVVGGAVLSAAVLTGVIAWFVRNRRRR